jgi:hypothetical protein
MYFEDTDLFLRLRKSGFRLLIDPRAQVIHYYDQAGRQVPSKKQAYLQRSRQHFMRRYDRSIWRLLRNVLAGLNAIRPHVNKTEELPIYRTPFQVCLPRRLQHRWLLEWSPHPNYVPTVGAFGSGRFVRFSHKYCGKMAPGIYYGRVASLHQDSLRLTHGYRFRFRIEGRGPGRQHPND